VGKRMNPRELPAAGGAGICPDDQDILDGWTSFLTSVRGRREGTARRYRRLVERIAELVEEIEEEARVDREARGLEPLGLQGVEVFEPSVLLASGMCLVDTPGLGSVFAANTAATRELIPHIDAVIAVLGADPPISGEELELLAEVAHQTPYLLLVLNKLPSCRGRGTRPRRTHGTRLPLGGFRSALPPAVELSRSSSIASTYPPMERCYFGTSSPANGAERIPPASSPGAGNQ
jgi:hypothetical protein